MILVAYTISDPRAVMVHTEDIAANLPTVVRTIGLESTIILTITERPIFLPLKWQEHSLPLKWQEHFLPQRSRNGKL
jgi:hypothetical protein